jgi:hypothetical protein
MLLNTPAGRETSDPVLCFRLISTCQIYEHRVQMSMCTVSDLVKRTARGQPPTHAQQTAIRRPGLAAMCCSRPTSSKASLMLCERVARQQRRWWIRIAVPWSATRAMVPLLTCRLANRGAVSWAFALGVTLVSTHIDLLRKASCIVMENTRSAHTTSLLLFPYR